MVFIYVLELEQGKYYIGKTTMPNFRIESHFNTSKYASAYTNLYKPLKVVELIADCLDYEKVHNHVYA